MKLVPALRAETRGAVKAESAVVLHVTESAGPSEESDSISITLLAVTAVVLITQVAAEALVAQENRPARAAPQVTSEGLAADPFAAHLVPLPPQAAPASASVPAVSLNFTQSFSVVLVGPVAIPVPVPASALLLVTVDTVVAIGTCPAVMPEMTV